MASAAAADAAAMATPAAALATATPALRDSPARWARTAMSPGLDGEISFFEFTQDAWDEMLARPWITQLVPTEGVPRRHADRARKRIHSHRTGWCSTGVSMVPTLNVDQSLSVAIPLSIAGGEKSVIVRRDDGTESNRLSVWIKPQLDAFTAALAPNATSS